MAGSGKPKERPMKKSFVRGTWQKSRAFSPAVITEGGKVTWIAGHTGQKDPAGNSLAGDFEAQMRQTFKNIETTLKESGASLKDIVTMTVFLADSRYTTPMTEIRTEIFGEDFPASAAITVTGFADPSMLIEIQGIAVIGFAQPAKREETKVSAISVEARLDRLPVTGLHRKVFNLIGVGMFFEGFDIYIAESVLGATYKTGFSTLEQNGLFISMTFVGMTLGALLTGFLGDRYGPQFTYQVNLLVFGAAALASAVAPNMTTLIVLRFLMGLGLRR